MQVFACVFSIQEQLTHEQRQTFPLSSRLLSFFVFYFSTFLSETRKGTLTQSPRNQPGGLWTTHRAGSPSSSLSLPAHFTLANPAWPRKRGGHVPGVACLHHHFGSLFARADVNCRDDGHWVWYWSLWDHPVSQSLHTECLGFIFQRLRCSQNVRAEWD